MAEGAKRIEQLAPELDRIISTSEPIHDLADGFGGAQGPAEGPLWWREGGYLVFSDIHNNRRMKYEPGKGVSLLLEPTNRANGLTRDLQGRLVACEHDSRRVTRQELDGSITVIANSFQGRQLNRPNDVVVKSDSSIWFSDNGAGIRGNYLGHKATPELPYRVYRLDPATGQLTIAVGDMKRPNGLAFSPDEKLLYVIDTPGPGQRTIQLYDVVDNGTKTANRREFNSAEPGGSDGMRVDVQGNSWCAWSGGEAEDGVVVFAPDGKMIGRIMLPERCANVCFGGVKRNRLFMAASQSIYSLYVETQGALGG